MIAALSALGSVAVAQDPVPAPAPAAATPAPAPKITVMTKGTQIETAVAIINSQSPDSPVRLIGRASKATVSIEADGLPLEQVLTKLAEPAGLVWWHDASGYVIAGKAYANTFGPDGEIAHKNPALLPPAPSAKSPKVDVTVDQAKMADVLNAIGMQIDKPIKAHGTALGSVISMQAEGQPAEVVIDRITTPGGLVWWHEDGGYGVSDAEYYRTVVVGLPPSTPIPATTIATPAAGS